MPNTAVTQDAVNLAQHRAAVLRQQLIAHPVYAQVHNLAGLSALMREHVFAVWDFMSLLKRMQQMASCCTIPWQPVADARMARFINEIVLAEECDEDGRGGYASHFELYLDAMAELMVDTNSIQNLLKGISQGADPYRLLDALPIQQETRDFVRTTLQIVRMGQPHEVAAAFFFGREDVIPEMFARISTSLEQQGASVERLKHYLQRHIELDGDSHGPLSRQLLDNLCGNDLRKQLEAAQAASRCIEARLKLWDGVCRAISTAATAAA